MRIGLATGDRDAGFLCSTGWPEPPRGPPPGRRYPASTIEGSEKETAERVSEPRMTAEIPEAAANALARGRGERERPAGAPPLGRHELGHGIVSVSQRVTGPSEYPPTRALAVAHHVWSPGASFTMV
jgi:hypothetical protein